MYGDALRRELVAQRLERAEEVGALAVEHVDEDHAREAELVGELPRPRRAHLDAHHGRDGHERALDDPSGAPQLALERRIARHVDQVDLPVLPLRVLERHRDRELPLVLVLIRVGDRRSRLDRSETVDLARLEEERLDERRLPDPAVTDDGDVADPCGLGHGRALLLGARFRPRSLVTRNGRPKGGSGGNGDVEHAGENGVGDLRREGLRDGERSGIAEPRTVGSRSEQQLTHPTPRGHGRPTAPCQPTSPTTSRFPRRRARGSPSRALPPSNRGRPAAMYAPRVRRGSHRHRCRVGVDAAR